MKTVAITIRMTKHERQTINDAAKAAGGSVNDYCRGRIGLAPFVERSERAEDALGSEAKESADDAAPGQGAV